MNKLLLLLIPILGLIGCSTTPPQKSVYSQILDEQQAKRNKVAALTAAHGSPWVYMGQSVTNEKYYLNVETVKKSSISEIFRVEGSNQASVSDPTQAWWKIVSPNNSYIQIQSNFYCNINAAKETSAVQYSASDQYISSPKITTREAKNIIPNTVFSKVYDLACSLS